MSGRTDGGRLPNCPENERRVEHGCGCVITYLADGMPADAVAHADWIGTVRYASAAPCCWCAPAAKPDPAQADALSATADAALNRLRAKLRARRIVQRIAEKRALEANDIIATAVFTGSWLMASPDPSYPHLGRYTFGRGRDALTDGCPVPVYRVARHRLSLAMRVVNA